MPQQQWQGSVTPNGSGFTLCFTGEGATHTIPMTRGALQELYSTAGQYLIGGGVQTNASKTVVAGERPRKGAPKRSATRAK
jgi:hypothetical protein